MSDGDEDKRGDRSSLFWLAYGQIAAMLGAFSLLVFASHFFDLGLKGVVREAFEGWVEYVRPTVGIPLQWLVDKLLEAWHFVVPTVVKDYFAIGLVLALSFFRALITVDPDAFKRGDENVATGVFMYMTLLTVAWPIGALIIWRAFARVDRARIFFGLLFAPLVYLALLVAANVWLTSYCPSARTGWFASVACGSH